MWLPWTKKKTPATTTKIHHNRAPSFTNFDTILSPYHQSPIHKHSLSLKDIETLMLTYPSPTLPPISPIHCHSPSLKDLNTLILSSPNHPKSSKPSSIFLRVKSWAQPKKPITPPNSAHRVVIYYTSLRIVRKTFEECKSVRTMLKSYRVKLDERDVSMDVGFLEELHGVMMKREKVVQLPRVYIDGKYVGGGEEIRRLHENGELKVMIQGLRLDEEDRGCKVCGGFRFVVCEHCDGSHRVFGDSQTGFMSCGKCNVNGLVRCHSCVSVVF